MKKCVFCKRSPPAVKMTKEHILRSKYRKHFPDEINNVHWNKRFKGCSGEETQNYRVIPQGPFDLTMNDVCKECNEGWLNNDIEIPTEPFIEPLIKGEPILLTDKARAYLSIWAVKTAMLRALLDSDPNMIPSEHYQWLMMRREPPPFTYVWVGKSDNYTNTHTRHVRHGWDNASCHLTTFVLGWLSLFVLGCENVFGANRMKPTISLLGAEKIYRIWPNGVFASTADLPPMPLGYIQMINRGQLPIGFDAHLEE